MFGKNWILMGKHNKTDYSEIYGLPEGSRVLRLTLEKSAWDITGTEEKPFELRKKGDWIESRLFKPNGEPKEYDYVLLINGYKASAPSKIFEFKRVNILSVIDRWRFSNGLTFKTEPGDYCIILGEQFDIGKI